MEVADNLRRLMRIQTIALWTGVMALCLALLWELRPRYRPPEAAHAPQLLEELATRIWLTEALGAPSDISTRNLRPCAAWDGFTGRLGQPRADVLAAMTSMADGHPAWTAECRPVDRRPLRAMGDSQTIRLEFPALVEAETLCKALSETVAAADLPARYGLTPAAVEALTRHYAPPARPNGRAPWTALLAELRLQQRPFTIATLERVRHHLDGVIACRRDGNWVKVVIPLSHRFDLHWFEW